MSRKQLYVDWETLNRLIKANSEKQKVVSMPDEVWYVPEAAKPPEPEWMAEKFDDLKAIIEEEVLNSRDKVASVSEQQYGEATECIRDGLQIKVDEDSKTIILLLVLDTQQESNNVSRHVHCDDGICFGGYVYDMPKDAYIVKCVDYMCLGTIPVSFVASVPKVGGWNIRVPMTEQVVERLLAPYYKRMLKGVREKYPKPRYALHYMQMLECN